MKRKRFDTKLLIALTFREKKAIELAAKKLSITQAELLRQSLYLFVDLNAAKLGLK